MRKQCSRVTLTRTPRTPHVVVRLQSMRWRQRARDAQAKALQEASFSKETIGELQGSQKQQAVAQAKLEAEIAVRSSARFGRWWWQ